MRVTSAGNYIPLIMDVADTHGGLPNLRGAAIGNGCNGNGVGLCSGADGVRSAVRDSLEAAEGSRTRTVRFADTNERRYKTLPLHPSTRAPRRPHLPFLRPERQNPSTIAHAQDRRRSPRDMPRVDESRP